MHISVVIPTFNRAWIFGQTIPALTNQTKGDFTYEVIFVANGSSDETDSILKSVVAANPEIFRYYWIDPTGAPAAPRNVGIRAATGDIILIIDDDVKPEPDLVLRHAEFHRQRPELQVAACGQVYVPEELLDDPMSVFHCNYSYAAFDPSKPLTGFEFWTCNVSVKREFMLAHGMFNERVTQMEDIEAGHRLERAGMLLFYLPAAKGQHLHRSSPAGLSAKAFTFGRAVYDLTAYIPAPMMKKKFGMVATDLGMTWFVKRTLRLTSFLVVDNPLTRLVLRLCGATHSKRSRLTDAYYGLMFRRAFFAGYYKTLFQARYLPQLRAIRRNRRVA